MSNHHAVFQHREKTDVSRVFWSARGKQEINTFLCWLYNTNYLNSLPWEMVVAVVFPEDGLYSPASP